MTRNRLRMPSEMREFGAVTVGFAHVMIAPVSIANARQCMPAWQAGFDFRLPIGNPGIPNSVIRAVALFDDGLGPTLYAAGTFALVGNPEFDGIAKWDGRTWLPVGGGLNGTANAMHVWDQDGPGINPPSLYVGGAFTLAGDRQAFYIARWDGTEWFPVGVGLGSPVHAISRFDEDGAGPGLSHLVVGGAFSSLFNGTTISRGIARWNGSAWSSVGQSGLGDGRVYCLDELDLDGLGPLPARLLVGGDFSSVDSSTANRGITAWNGQSYESFGTGITGGAVEAVAVFDADGPGSGAPELFVGGDFSLAGGVQIGYGIARWNGASWSAVQGGANFGGGVYALATSDLDGAGPAPPRLFAGGNFIGIGAVGGAASKVAAWDGATWAPLRAGLDSTVRCFTTADIDGGGPRPGVLVIGGQFGAALGPPGLPSSGLAEWDGADWFTQPTGLGLDDTVRALVAFDDGKGSSVYAAGSFSRSASVQGMYGAARWTGAGWVRLGDGLEDSATAFAVVPSEQGDRLYAVTASHSGRVAEWTGNAWEVTGGPFDGPVHALLAYDPPGSFPKELYAAGEFTTAGGVPAQRIARWTGSAWAPLGDGLSDAVFALTVWDPDGAGPLPSSLYAGGQFEVAGTAYAPLVARWDGSDWTAVGATDAAASKGNSLERRNDGGATGADGLSVVDSVRAFAVYDDGGGEGLFAAGTFVRVGGVVARRIAKFDGAQWSPLGSGLSGPGYALAVYEDGFGEALYVGGDFATAGGVIAKSLAKWRGGSWSQAHGGVRGSVHALLAFDPGPGPPSLFVGGEFDEAGSTASVNIAELKGCPVPPAAFPLVSPASGATCVGLTPVLTWTPEPNADSYRVRISRSAALTNPVVDAPGIATASFAPAAGILLPATQYYWGVEAENATGSAPSSPSSRVFVTTLLGDADLNGAVNFVDLNIVLGAFGSTTGQPSFFPGADFNADGHINFLDLNIVLSSFGLGC